MKGFVNKGWYASSPRVSSIGSNNVIIQALGKKGVVKFGAQPSFCENYNIIYELRILTLSIAFGELKNDNWRFHIWNKTNRIPNKPFKIVIINY
jgi:hypothetical protein